jgi:hypothetical protein
MPIILCSAKRQGKVAPELSEKSYCPSKRLYYYGAMVRALLSRKIWKNQKGREVLHCNTKTHDLWIAPNGY